LAQALAATFQGGIAASHLAASPRGPLPGGQNLHEGGWAKLPQWP